MGFYTKLCYFPTVRLPVYSSLSSRQVSLPCDLDWRVLACYVTCIIAFLQEPHRFETLLWMLSRFFSSLGHPLKYFAIAQAKKEGKYEMEIKRKSVLKRLLCFPCAEHPKLHPLKWVLERNTGGVKFQTETPVSNQAVGYGNALLNTKMFFSTRKAFHVHQGQVSSTTWSLQDLWSLLFFSLSIMSVASYMVGPRVWSFTNLSPEMLENKWKVYKVCILENVTLYASSLI